MTTDESLALAALALFLAVSLWLGLTRHKSQGQDGTTAPPPSLAALLDRTAFIRVPLLTPGQDHLYSLIAAYLSRRNDGHCALPQAALAALLQPVASGHPAHDTAALAALGARRLDVAILDTHGRLTAAILLGQPDDIVHLALDRAAVPMLVAAPGDHTFMARLDALLALDAALLSPLPASEPPTPLA